MCSMHLATVLVWLGFWWQLPFTVWQWSHISYEAQYCNALQWQYDVYNNQKLICKYENVAEHTSKCAWISTYSHNIEFWVCYCILYGKLRVIKLFIRCNMQCKSVECACVCGRETAATSHRKYSMMKNKMCPKHMPKFVGQRFQWNFNFKLSAQLLLNMSYALEVLWMGRAMHSHPICSTNWCEWEKNRKIHNNQMNIEKKFIKPLNIIKIV